MPGLVCQGLSFAGMEILCMPSRRSQFIDLVEQKLIAPDQLEAALELADLYPDQTRWFRFLNLTLLALGVLALGVSAVFFIAYNWNEMGRFAKFAGVEVLVVLAVVAYVGLGTERIAAKFSLLLASILLGALLALFGQTYQTGADPWQLFMIWSLMILPWVLLARLAGLWLFWLALVNVAVINYQVTMGSLLEHVWSREVVVWWLVVVVNLLAQMVWELAARRWLWLDRRWAVRSIAVLAGGALTMLMLHQIFDHGQHEGVATLVWFAWLGALYGIYRKVLPDLFMLAGFCLSLIVVVTGFLARHMLDHDDPLAFLLLAGLVIAMGSGAAFWLRGIHREQAA